MRFRASNLLLLAALVVAMVGVVMLSASAQRNAAHNTIGELESNGEMLGSTLELMEATEGYVTTGDRSWLRRYNRVGRDLERAITRLTERIPPDDHAEAGEQIASVRSFQDLAQAAVETRLAGAGPAVGLTERGLAEQGRRIEVFDRAIQANRATANAVDDALEGQQFRATIASLVAVSLLGVMILLLGLGARRDELRRRRTHRFRQSLQAARSETEAYELVCAHIERSVAGSDVAVFNRNNSSDRLEATTELEPGSRVAEGLRDARPDDCLAVRTARPSRGGTSGDELVRCEICGAHGGNSYCVPSIVGGEVIGSVLVRSEAALGEDPKRTVAEGVSEAAPVVAHVRNLAIAERQASSDRLTGLANKRSAEDVSGRMVARALRTGNPLSAVVFDLDRFKRINDTYGHPKGDEVLAAVGSAVSDLVRDGDLAARDGGEEFLVIAPGTDREGAEILAEKLREAIGELRVPGIDGGITASFGVAALHRDAGSREELLRLGDRALYAAKRAGRDRVCTPTEPENADAVNGDPRRDGELAAEPEGTRSA